MPSKTSLSISPTMRPESILGLTADAFCGLAAEDGLNLPVARAHYRRVMRDGCGEGPYPARPLPVVSRLEEDGVVKLGQRTADGHLIESVVIPMPKGTTLCLSSQIGCRMGCRFCRTAGMGLVRNLEPWEIVSQVWTARHAEGGRPGNLVFMGMGEPADNVGNVLAALRVLTDPEGLSFSKSAIMVSTCGFVPGMDELARAGWRRLNLAVSLNAADDAVRAAIMPVNRAYPLVALRAAMERWPMRKAGVICIEYVVLHGVNDARTDARAVADFLRGLRVRLHVIPHNHHAASPYPPPDDARIQAFVTWLREEGLHATRRISRGKGILAACGQLASGNMVREGGLEPP